MKFLYWGILLFILASAGIPVQDNIYCTDASLHPSKFVLKEIPANDEKNLPKKEEREENKEKEDDRSEEENKFNDSVLSTTLCEFGCLSTIQLFAIRSIKIELFEKWTATLVAPLYILYSNLKINC